jgi:hypothetical protein
MIAPLEVVEITKPGVRPDGLKQTSPRLSAFIRG